MELLTKNNECSGSKSTVEWDKETEKAKPGTGKALEGCYEISKIDLDAERPGIQADCVVTELTGTASRPITNRCRDELQELLDGEHAPADAPPVEGKEKAETPKTKYEIKVPTNAELAANLKGRLLLVHGEIDNNVHPANTVQLIDELEKANKSFDLVWAPNRNHGLNEPYVIRRRWDYFVEHLLGQRPPDNYEIVKPTEPWQNAAATPADDPR